MRVASLATGLLLIGCNLPSSSTDNSQVSPYLGASMTRNEPRAKKPKRHRDPAPTLQAIAEGRPDPACAPEMVHIGSYCIDRYEAYLVERTPDGRERAHSPYERPAANVEYEARSAPGKVPQAYINRPEAEAACNAAGKRLCSVNEWHAACTGERGTTFPYGATHEAGKCNAGKAHLLSRFFGGNPRAWKYKEHFNNPMLNQQPGFLAPAGEYAECVSDYGVADMVGNLHEWVSDKVDGALAKKLALESGISVRLGLSKGRGIFMGGFYSTTNQHGEGCNFVTVGHEPGYHDYSTGFRCCSDAE